MGAAAAVAGSEEVITDALKKAPSFAQDIIKQATQMKSPAKGNNNNDPEDIAKVAQLAMCGG